MKYECEIDLHRQSPSLAFRNERPVLLFGPFQLLAVFLGGGEFFLQHFDVFVEILLLFFLCWPVPAERPD